MQQVLRVYIARARELLLKIMAVLAKVGTLRERLPSILVDPCLYYCCTTCQALAALRSLCTEGCARTIRSTCGVHNVVRGLRLLYSLRKFGQVFLTRTVHMYIRMCVCCTHVLAGVSCPRAPRIADGPGMAAEPFGEEALLFTKELILQREVHTYVCTYVRMTCKLKYTCSKISIAHCCTFCTCCKGVHCREIPLLVFVQVEVRLVLHIVVHVRFYTEDDFPKVIFNAAFYGQCQSR